MYIYLDESYNLKDRDKKQFISINGFMVFDVAKVRKAWLKARKPYVKKQRIHAHKKIFMPLRKKAFEIIRMNQVYLLSVIQEIHLISTKKEKGYWEKDKINFEKVYIDLCRKLLFSLRLDEYKKVVITIDNRKNKSGIIGKNIFREIIKSELNTRYPDVLIKKPRLVPSSSDILLEMADFISNSFYKYYQANEQGELSDFLIKTNKIKNPLK